MKTSINFKAVKSDSEVHNFRKKTFDYIRKDLSSKNEYWQEDKISDRILKIETYCKQKSGRKLQKNAMPIREAVVVIKEDTTMLELQNLASKLQEELRIRIFQIAIHKDEGHYDKETNDWKPNYHAHLVADWQDLGTGKTLKHQSFHYSKMQDIAAECLEMERGMSGSVGRLEAVEFKIKKKEEELQTLEQKITEMRQNLGSNKFQDLISKNINFFGTQRINTDQTIANFAGAFKLYNATLQKHQDEVNINKKQIDKLQKEVQFLKKENTRLKNKNTALLVDNDVFAGEKKKYLDDLINVIEKAIRQEAFKNPNRDRTDNDILVQDMNTICNRLSQENNIPVAAFQQVFKMMEVATELWASLQLSSMIICSPTEENEQIPLHLLKKKRKRKLSR